ncbi:MAG: RNA chaperone Hfq [Acidobacteria bacterium]|nr:RNA chaperone Hfq [Acidobacteriota bacterium]
MTERKLIRPNLNQYRRQREHPQEKPVRESEAGRESGAANSSQPQPHSSSGGPRHKQVPPEQTNAENFYYVKQMNSKTQVIVVLLDGEEIHGWIEWYDKNCIKVHTYNEQNYLIFKHSIKYITKERQG